MGVKAILQAIIGRLILLLHSISVIVYTTSLMDNDLYWLYVFLLLAQVFEMIYVVADRRGKEYSWISLSTVCYLIAVVPPMWTVELKLLSDFQNNRTDMHSNITSSHLEKVTGIYIDIDDNVGLEILKQTLLLVIMLHRWVIPRGVLSRNSLSHLLFVFFAVASDIMELFELFDNVKVKRDGIVGYAILAVWTLSLTQMSFVLTNTRLSRRARPTKVDDTLPDELEESAEDRACCRTALATDIWSILITLATMDVPFLVVRLYILVQLKVITYGIIFFTCKNMLVILLSGYRLAVICCDTHHDDEHGDASWKKRMSDVSSKTGLTDISKTGNDNNMDTDSDHKIDYELKMENEMKMRNDAKMENDMNSDNSNKTNNSNETQDSNK